MSALFWVGGTGSYDGVTNHFATTSGAAATVAAVTSVDDVTFDSLSGSGTVTISATWSSNTIAMNASSLTVTTNGSSTLTTVGAVTLTNGTFNTNGSTCSFGSVAWGTGTKTLTLGASSITLSGAGTVWGSSTGNTTFNANTSSISCTAGSNTFGGNGLTFNNLTMAGGSNTLTGANTFNNFTCQPTAGSGWGIAISSDQTITGTLTLIGSNTAAAVGRGFIANVVGVSTTLRTITAANVNLQNIDFMSVNAQGSSIPWTGVSLGNAGGNINITFPASRTLYWVNNGGNWNNPNNWSRSSNGAAGANECPRAHDDIIVDAKSITKSGQSINIGTAPRTLGRNIDMSAALNKPILALGSFNAIAGGSFALAPGMTTTGTLPVVIAFYSGGGTNTFTSNGVIFNFSINFQTIANFTTAGTQLQDNLTVAGIANAATFTHVSGVFNANNFNITAPGFSSSNANTRTITMGSGTWTLNGTGTVWNTGTTTGLTLNKGTSTISITEIDGAGKIFSGGGMTYNNLTITGGGTGDITFGNSNNTFNNLTVNNPKTLKFPAGGTLTCANFTANGVSGSLIYMRSSINGYPWKLTVLNGYSTSFIDLQDSDASSTTIT